MNISPRDNRCGITLLPEHAGMCQSLVFTASDGRSIDVIAGCTEQELASGNPWYRGYWLYPFPSRLANGKYTWQERDYRLPLNEPERDNALHGFLTGVTPEVTDRNIQQDSAEVTLRYQYDGANPGYPFPGEVTVTYRLQSPGHLTISVSVMNLHDAPVPVGTGWHPYFSFGGKVDDLCLQLPAGDLVAVDERLLPTGPLTPFTDFAALSRMNDLTIDSALKLHATGDTRAQALLWSPDKQVGIVTWQDTGSESGAGYRYLQIFIPPDRASIALEPVSCGINAFNTGENLLVLAPGQHRVFTNGVSLVNSAGEFSTTVRAE